MELTRFERDLLENLIEGDAEESVLRGQLGLASVAERDYTGVGIYITLLIPEYAPRTRMANRDLHTTPMAYLRHPELKAGAQAVLWFEDALMSTIECLALEGLWPSDESKFVIEYYGFPDMRRDKH